MSFSNRHARFALLAPAALVLFSAQALPAAQVDDRIEAAARNSYNFKTTLKDDSIKVQSSGGVVTLKGTVAHDYHRILAEETVAGLPGVKGVTNELTVPGELPAERSDGWVTMKVKTVLAFHKNVSATDTEVLTSNGVVTLRGKAQSEAQKTLTAEYAKDVEGVQEVRNEMVVAAPGTARKTLGQKVDDTSVTARVKTSLLFNKSTHALAAKVITRNGIVSLHGEARNEAERSLVTRLAQDIDGVRRVNNHMTVRP